MSATKGLRDKLEAAAAGAPIKAAKLPRSGGGSHTAALCTSLDVLQTSGDAWLRLASAIDLISAAGNYSRESADAVSAATFRAPLPELDAAWGNWALDSVAAAGGNLSLERDLLSTWNFPDCLRLLASNVSAWAKDEALRLWAVQGDRLVLQNH